MDGDYPPVPPFARKAAALELRNQSGGRA
jgi:hypothetical protein